MANNTIELDKNYNSKLGCEFIVHIMRPAKKGIKEETFKQEVMFKVGDFEWKYRLEDYAKDKLANLPAHLRMASHGNMTRGEFMEVMNERYELHEQDEAGVYFFVKV